MLKGRIPGPYTKTLSVAGAGLALALAASAAEAAPLRPTAPHQGGIVQLAHDDDIYIDGYNRHRHHHGHVHGNPYRRHLDCNWHGDHEHCQVHVPRRRHYHHYDYYDEGYRPYRRRDHYHDHW
jgi:hypothetical protein